jgi:hypothetical protein
MINLVWLTLFSRAFELETDSPRQQIPRQRFLENQRLLTNDIHMLSVRFKPHRMI